MEWPHPPKEWTLSGILRWGVGIVLVFTVGVIVEENARDVADTYHLNRLWSAGSMIMDQLSPILANRWTWLLFFSLSGSLITIIAGQLLGLDRTDPEKNRSRMIAYGKGLLKIAGIVVLLIGLTALESADPHYRHPSPEPTKTPSEVKLLFGDDGTPSEISKSNLTWSVKSFPFDAAAPCPYSPLLSTQPPNLSNILGTQPTQDCTVHNVITLITLNYVKPVSFSKIGVRTRAGKTPQWEVFRANQNSAVIVLSGELKDLALDIYAAD